MSNINHRRVAPNNVNRDLYNEKIPFKEVRVIDANGDQLGILSKREALSIAEKQNLDLLCVAPGSKPPVCKILDYGRYHFEQQKKAKEAKRAFREAEKAKKEAEKNMSDADRLRHKMAELANK